MFYFKHSYKQKGKWLAKQMFFLQILCLNEDI